MALPPRLHRELEEVARELDLVVYRLERPPPAEPDAERKRLRRELERLGQQLDDILRAIG